MNLTDGTLTVNQKAINYTIGDAQHDYGSVVDFATALPATFLTGVNGENLGITYSSAGNLMTSNVGNYAITGSWATGQAWRATIA